MYTKEQLERAIGCELSEKKVVQLNEYIEMLLERNQQTNLTAITDPQEMLVKHIEDCGKLCAMLKSGENILDVGTGAGFPGIIIAIVRDDVKVTMLDSIGKKLDFVEEVVEKLGLEAEIRNGRAEMLGKDAAFREQYDVVTARAVADMATLAELCLPIVKVGGRMLAMKGANARQEQEEAVGAATLLGCDDGQVVEYKLSDGSERGVICYEKIKQTPDKYPRNAAQIKKKPLKSI